MKTRRPTRLRALPYAPHQSERQGYRITVFEPLGQYPKGIIASEQALFWADRDLVFSVVHGTASWHSVDEDLPYTEFDWIGPDLLRFLASILLCEKIDDPKIILYPVIGYHPLVDATFLDLQSIETAQRVKQLILDGIVEGRNSVKEQRALFKRKAFGLLKRKKTSVHQAIAGLKRRGYQLVETSRFNLDRQPLLWRKIYPSNFLLMRGIYALIKGDMLSRHRQFFEEATISTYIALEASFRLVCNELQKTDIKQPTARDAAQWLHDHFDSFYGLEQPMERYFEEFYDQRIMTMHPSSRFGDFPFSPIMHDDFVHLRRSLPQIFAYIASGEHPPDFYEDVAWQRRHTGVSP